jgi:FkbM family methyltransferase
LGQEIAIIKELSAEYKFKFLCISFEPVPDLFQIITDKYKNEISTGILEVNQFAIGKPKKNKLYIKSSENNKNDGSSIYKHKSNITKNILEIKTFELSKILTAVELKKYSHVILKIDSEGSEYDIMKNLIKTNNINIFSYILLEDHSRKIKSLTWQINRLFVRRKLSKMNVTVDNW